MDWAMKEKSYSQAKACSLVGIDAKTYRYRSKRGDDGEVRKRLENWPPNAGGSAIGVCTSCSPAKAPSSTARSCIGSTRRSV